MTFQQTVNLENILATGPLVDQEKPVSISNFGLYSLDRNNALLTKNQSPVALTPKAFNLLCYLVDNAGKLVTKDEIFASVWPNVVVGDAALTVCIREIRKALEESSQQPFFIETVHKRGYRFRQPMQIETPSANEKIITGLVGREEPLQILDQCFKEALASNRQLIFVTGEAGIGKTTLIEKFIQNIPDDSKTIKANGQCIEQYGAGEAYLPVLDALGRLCKEQDQPFLDLLAHAIPSWLPHLPVLCNAVNKHDQAQLMPSGHPEKMLREMAEALETIAQIYPLVLYLEDLQWADHATIDLLSFLARRKDVARLMIIGSFRPADIIISHHPLKNLKQDLQLRGCCLHIPLEYLNKGEISHYLTELFPKHLFPEPFVQFLQHQTNGNPLFLINIIEDLKKAEFLVKKDNNWQLNGDLSQLDKYVPDNIQAMIAQQIERLIPEHQKLLEAACVASEPGGIAMQFNLAETASALDDEVMQHETQFEVLTSQCHFLRELGVSENLDDPISSLYEFTHTLYQNVLYQRVSPARKVYLHRRLGEKLEQDYGDKALQIASKLAVHFEHGRVFSKAIFYLCHSAKIASQRGADREAVFTLNKARKLLAKLPEPNQRNPLELSILQQLGPALTASQGNTHAEIETCYLRAKELCQELQDEQQLFPILFGLRSYYLIKGDLDLSFTMAQELLKIAKRLKCQGLLLEAHVGLANSYFFAGNPKASYQQAQAGVLLYDQKQHDDHASRFGLDPGVLCFSRAGQTAWALGMPDTGLDYVQQAEQLGKQLNHPYSYCFALLNLTLVHLYRKEGIKALSYILQSQKLAKTHDFKFLFYWGAFLKTWSLSLTKEIAISKTEISKRLHELQSAKSLPHSFLAIFLAEACCHTKDYQKGQAALGIPQMEHIYDAERLRLEGKILLALSSDKSQDIREKAEQLFRNALKISQEQDTKSFSLRAAMSLYLVQNNTKQKQEALKQLLTIYNEFQEGHDTADLKQAKQMLGLIK